ncbi:MAG: pro-sigmaK processing inhibitor BofA family protein [Candidatus Woesearchaeota archaeon]
MIAQIITLAIIIFVFAILVVFIRKLGWLILNSIIGFFALLFTKIFLPDLVINAWSILITAIGGVPGYLIVIIFHLLGIAF